VPEETKRRRNNELLAIQNAISGEDNQAFVGRGVEVLVEGPSKLGLKQADNEPIVQLTGRTSCDRIVVFDGNRRQIGRIVPVAIYDASDFTLFGAIETHHAGPEVYDLQLTSIR
jgi:tRNA-2-methylthio-N6-dimethylallyladenosine synthase